MRHGTRQLTEVQLGRFCPITCSLLAAYIWRTVHQTLCMRVALRDFHHGNDNRGIALSAIALLLPVQFSTHHSLLSMPLLIVLLSYSEILCVVGHTRLNHRPLEPLIKRTDRDPVRATRNRRIPADVIGSAVIA